MLDRFTEPLRLLAAGTLALAVGFGAGSVWGLGQGASNARLEAAQTVVSEHEDWNDAESDAERLDAYERCIGVGGLPDQCSVVLRDRAPATGQ